MYICVCVCVRVCACVCALHKNIFRYGNVCSSL